MKCFKPTIVCTLTCYLLAFNVISCHAAGGNKVAQVIQLRDTKIEVTRNGEVWINGDRAGAITKEGEIWVGGDKTGELTRGGEVWKAGEKVGEITKDGDVWKSGNEVGNVTKKGVIWIDGSREGTFQGGPASHVGAIVFFGFYFQLES